MATSNKRKAKRALRRASKDRIVELKVKKLHNEINAKNKRREKVRDNLGLTHLEVKAHIKHIITNNDKQEKRPTTVIIVPSNVYKIIGMGSKDYTVNNVKIQKWDRDKHSTIILMNNIDINTDMYAD